MSERVTQGLKRAVEAYECLEDEEALQRLLEAWREVRVERFAELAERLSKLANKPVPREGLLGLPCALERVVAQEKEGRGSPAESVASLLEDLGRWPADPRLTLALLDLAAQPVAHQEQVFLPLCELFLQVKDPCALRPLQILHARLPQNSPYGRMLLLTLERMDVGPIPKLQAEAATLCDVLKEAMDRRQESQDPRLARSSVRRTLFARVHAAPDDEGARLVLADHLLEQDDPLGEFIVLQCQPQPDAARVAWLLEKHGEEWARELLGRHVEYRRTRFERGLPVAVRMAGDGLSPPGPSWCTVREIDWNGSWLDYTEWLAHPYLRNVTVLRNVTCSTAARLGAHPLPVRKLGMHGQAAAQSPQVFNTLAALPHLTWLEILEGEPNDVRLCAASPLARRLERFEVSRTGAWSLVVAPAAEVSVEATLLSEEGCEVFAEAVGAAAAMSHRALRIQSQRRLSAGRRRLLEAAAAAYAHVEWSLPPRGRGRTRGLG